MSADQQLYTSIVNIAVKLQIIAFASLILGWSCSTAAVGKESGVYIMHAHVGQAQDTCYPTSRCTWHKTCAALKHRQSIKFCPHLDDRSVMRIWLDMGAQVSG